MTCLLWASEGCRMLENFNLSWCDQITSDGIEALSRGCTGLRALFLRGCTQVHEPNTHSNFIVVSDWAMMSSHDVFDVSFQLDDTALKHLQKHCPELMTINMQSCTVRLWFVTVLSLNILLVLHNGWEFSSLNQFDSGSIWGVMIQLRTIFYLFSA